MSKKIFIKNGLLMILFAWLLLSCADWANVDKSSAEYLKARAEARWQALIKKDWTAAYQFELPAYRETHDINQYQAKFGKTLLWKSVKVDEVKIVPESDTADVRVTLAYDFNMPGSGVMEGSSQINERWLKQSDDWWLAD